jgi:hypothetical protein
MHQSLQGAKFQVEHVALRSFGGASEVHNLAWACPNCNLHKSNRVRVALPGTSETVRLFNPRTDHWEEHFGWDGYHVVGRTPIGLAAIDALELNHDRRIRIRKAEALFDLFPPGDEEAKR